MKLPLFSDVELSVSPERVSLPYELPTYISIVADLVLPELLPPEQRRQKGYIIPFERETNLFYSHRDLQQRGKKCYDITLCRVIRSVVSVSLC